jgi:hypothetical protein
MGRELSWKLQRHFTSGVRRILVEFDLVGLISSVVLVVQFFRRTAALSGKIFF